MDCVPNTWPVLRQFVRRLAADLPADLADVSQPGFHNNLRWQVGHVVASAEGLMLGFLGRPMTLDPVWRESFDMGTSPASFTAETPDWAAILAGTDRSTAAITAMLEELPASTPLARSFEIPGVLKADTLGEIAAFAGFHEAMHYGVMRVMAGNLTSD